LLVAATTTMVLLVLDSSIGGVLLPSISRELGLSHAEQAWALASYLIALAVLLPVGGRVADRIGPVAGFRLGTVGFLAGSLAIGLARAPAVLIAGRVLAGAAAALLMPATLAVLSRAFPAADRPRAMAVYTGAGQAFAVVGPALGGLCAQFADWRWAFLANIPVGAAGLALIRRAAPANLHQARGRAPGGLGLAPLRVRSFSAATGVLAALGFAMTIATVYGAVSLQVALGLNPAEGGLAMLPLVVPLLVATRRVARCGAALDLRRTGIRGALLLAAGSLGLGLGCAGAWLPVTAAAMVPAGVGIALLLSPMTTAALGSVPAGQRGQAGGLASTARQLGGVAGIALTTQLIGSAGERLGSALAFTAAAVAMLGAVRAARAV